MINNLSDVIKKRGENFVREALSDKVIISEKLDTFRIQFEMSNDKSVRFMTKDGRDIGPIERTLNDIWEMPLSELPILIKNADIKEGMRFGLYYTPVERPIRIPYENVPRYVLTDITLRDDKGKVMEALDTTMVNVWSGKLCVGVPPVLFEGILTDKQINDIISYAKNEFDEVDNLSEYIFKEFGTTFSGEKIIEGIVINSPKLLSKVTSYEFEILNDAYDKMNTPRNIYEMLMLSIGSYMDSYKLPILEGTYATIDEKYISIISDMFNGYCDTNNINESMNLRYITPTNYGDYKGKLQTSFIKNKKTLSYVSKSPVYESVFKIFLTSFRKVRKPHGVLNESFTDKFNSYVYTVQNYIGNKAFSDGKLYEALEDRIDVKAVRNRQPSDISSMMVIASIQKAFSPTDRNRIEGNKKCVVYITTFSPFTMSQFNNVVNMSRQWSCGVILAAVSSTRRTPGKAFTVSDDTVKAQMTAMRNAHDDIIYGHMMLSSWNLLDIFESCRPDFEPVAIVTDKGKKSEMGLQLFFEEEVMNRRIGVSDKFNIGEMENTDKLMSLRSIEDDNFNLFNDLVPAPIRGMYNTIIGEYKVWNGSILSNHK